MQFVTLRSTTALRFSGALPKRGFDDDSADDVSTAALLAGQLQIEAATPFVKELEKSEYVGLYGGSINTDLPSGTVDPFFLQQFTIRQISQLSLRRLGVAPAPLPVYVFPKHGVDDVFRPKTPANRAENAKRIGPGMAALDVLQSLGSPDFISYPNWSYDFDGQNPKSMTIELDAGFVRRVEVGEPLWRKGLVRNEAVVGF